METTSANSKKPISHFEIGFVGIIIALFLLTSIGGLYDNKISHSYPFGYLASDAFQHETRAQSILDMGNYRNEANYIARQFDNVIGYYPPLMYHSAIMFSLISGIQIYDAIILFIFLFTALSIIVMYLVIRDFNINAAILSMPLVFYFAMSNTKIGFTWGHWPALTAGVFLVAIIWSLIHIKEKFGYVIFALLVSGVLMSHSSEAVFASAFCAVFLIIDLIFNFKKKEFLVPINMIKGAAIALVITLYYLIIFRFTWAIAQPFRNYSTPYWDSNPGFYLYMFGWPLIIMIMGLLVSYFYYIKKPHPILLSGPVFLVLGYGNLIGFDWRAFQLRMLWPILLAPLLGFGLYFIFKTLIKNWSVIYSIILSFAVCFLLLASPIIGKGSNECAGTLTSGAFATPHLLTGFSKCLILPLSETMTAASIADSEHWDTLTWIEKNTPKNAKIYFFFAPIYTQDAILRTTRRIHYLANTNDYIAHMQNGSLSRMMVTKIPGDAGALVPYRNSTFTFGFYALEVGLSSFSRPIDVCSSDYYVFDGYPAEVANFNNKIIQLFTKNGMIPEHKNQISVILKNPNPGGNCLA